MITGDFRKWEVDQCAFSPVLVEALEYLRTAPFDQIEDGVYPLNETGTYLVLKEVVTSSFVEVRPEKHHRYIDIHYLITGMEKIGFARDHEKNKPVNVSPDVEDHTFFDFVEQEKELILYPGQFVVFMPSDVHRPWCMAHEERIVRKALIKLPVSEA